MLPSRSRPKKFKGLVVLQSVYGIEINLFASNIYGIRNDQNSRSSLSKVINLRSVDFSHIDIRGTVLWTPQHIHVARIPLTLT